MSADWSRAQDLERLADAGVRHAFDVEIAQFPRVRAQLAADDGRASGEVRIGRVSGRPMAEVELHAVVPLVCQRCLARVDIPVESTSQVALLHDLGEGEGLPLETEPIVAEGGRLALRDLVEEELLLALPLIARHADPAQCARAAAVGSPSPRQEVSGGGSEERGDETSDAGDGPDDAARKREGAADDGSEGGAVHATQTPFSGLAELLKRRD